MRRRSSLAIAGVYAFMGLFNMLGYWWLAREKVALGQCDFLQFYAGATLHSSPDLFEPEAHYAIHRRETGDFLPSVAAFVRPPYYAFFLGPLALLPFRTAYWLWMGMNACAIACALLVMARVDDRTDHLLLGVSVYFPAVYTSILNGQDAGLLLFLSTATCFLILQGRNPTAGVTGALCSIKFHLFLFVPFALWMGKKHRALIAAAAAGMALLVVCFAVQGIEWPSRYFQLLRSGIIHPSPEIMPNLAQLLRLGGASERLAWIGGFVLAAGAGVVAMLRVEGMRARIAIAIVAGLLAAPHIYLHDTLLLLLAFSLARVEVPAMRIPLAAAMFPLTAAMLLKGAPYSALMPVFMAASVAVAIWKGSTPATPDAGR